MQSLRPARGWTRDGERKDDARNPEDLGDRETGRSRPLFGATRTDGQRIFGTATNFTAMLSHDDTTHSRRRKREPRDQALPREAPVHRTLPARVPILYFARCAAFPVPLLVLVLLLSLVRRLLLLPLSRYLRSRDANNSPPRFLRVHQQRSQAGLALSFSNGSAGRRNVGGWRRQRAAFICQDGGGAQCADRAATIAPHSAPSRTNRVRPPWHLAPPWRHADWSAWARFQNRGCILKGKRALVRINDDL